MKVTNVTQLSFSSLLSLLEEENLTVNHKEKVACEIGHRLSSVSEMDELVLPDFGDRLDWELEFQYE